MHGEPFLWQSWVGAIKFDDKIFHLLKDFKRPLEDIEGEFKPREV